MLDIKLLNRLKIEYVLGIRNSAFLCYNESEPIMVRIRLYSNIRDELHEDLRTQITYEILNEC